MPVPFVACGVVPIGELLQLALVEHRLGDPGGALDALTFEPGDAAAVERELAILEPAAVACGFRLPAPGRAEGQQRGAVRACDEALAAAGVRPNPPPARDALPRVERIEACVAGDGPLDRPPPPGVACETVPDAVFARILGLRPPARRHPFGVRARIEALGAAAIRLRGGSPWNRRIEEIDALACALCAAELARGNALLVGDRGEGLVALPGHRPLTRFETRGAVPVVERLALP